MTSVVNTKLKTLQGLLVVCLRELKQGLCINLEEWDGEGDGREFQNGEDVCIPMADHVEI